MVNGKRIVPGQANNSFAFPGTALAVLCARPYQIPDEVYLVVAHALAGYVGDDDPNTEKIYPDTTESCAVALIIAVNVLQYFIENGLANLYPIPENLCEFVKSHQYYTDYEPTVVTTWKYPEMPRVPITKKPGKDSKTMPKK